MNTQSNYRLVGIGLLVVLALVLGATFVWGLFRPKEPLRIESHFLGYVTNSISGREGRFKVKNLSSYEIVHESYMAAEFPNAASLQILPLTSSANAMVLTSGNGEILQTTLPNVTNSYQIYFFYKKIEPSYVVKLRTVLSSLGIGAGNPSYLLKGPTIQP